MSLFGVIASSDRSVPDAPTIGTATNVGSGRAFNNGRADVTFTAPTYTGRLPITGYTVTSSPGGFTGTGAASPISVTGLQSATAYTFTVTATNSVGNSAASAASNSITATTVPQAPTIGTATDGGTGTTVSVAFTGNATGGSAITTYTATSSPGGFTGTGAASPITVSGLTAGTAYTFTVTATNANGTSAASAASNSVTPAVPTSFDSLATITPSNNTTNTVTFSSISSSYRHLQIRLTSYDAAGNTIGIRFNGDSTSDIYNTNWIFANGSTVTASNQSNNSMTTRINTGYTSTSDTTGYIIDIFDYSLTTKFKIARIFAGNAGSQQLYNVSGMWRSTSAINSITLFQSGNYRTGTTFALYGIKG